MELINKAMQGVEPLKHIEHAVTNWRTTYQNVRPWTEFFDRARFSKPENLAVVRSRLMQNLVYYQTNYLMVFGVVLVYSLLTNLWFLFSILLLSGLFFYTYGYVSDEGVMLLNRRFSREQIYRCIAIATIPLMWISSAGYTIFWLCCASGLIITSHAIFSGPCLEMQFSSQV